MPLFIGTSGWQYDHWKRRLYPKGVPMSRWLEFYAERFATVESNNAFYRLPERKTFEAWRERTPDDFVMAVKVSRYLTHIKRLQEPQEPVERFIGRVRGLGSKLGPALIQLPPQMRVDAGRLRETLECFPRDVRVAVEFRHDSWWTDEVRGLLERYGAALCLADRYRPVSPLWRTADWTYVRFHGGRSRPPGCYGRAALQAWVERIREQWPADADAWVYFNNDFHACALANAVTFARLAQNAGMHPTRVPPMEDVTVD
ncbi:MAG: hypothetical protein QOH61_1292 [Chloroflexota bacterium]|jgi:uncharacterized protein YecE (DUF72 family)|nr:hypothetical protein [Chloroflexota bacterium]